ncbi:MAG: DNA-binding protein Alba [archaeon]
MEERTNADNSNTVFIGKKGTMSYVFAVITQLNQGATSVSIKARGKTISKAVDVAEIVRNKLMNSLSIEKIEISTEEVTTENNTPMKVSAIEIVLSK